MKGKVKYNSPGVYKYMKHYLFIHYTLTQTLHAAVIIECFFPLKDQRHT